MQVQNYHLLSEPPKQKNHQKYILFLVLKHALCEDFLTSESVSDQSTSVLIGFTEGFVGFFMNCTKPDFVFSPS